MLKLPKGITGFAAPESEVSVKRFTSTCHTAARQIGGLVHSVRPAYENGTQNFHDVSITFHTEKKAVRILCNAHYPYIAFVKPTTHEGDMRLEFVDSPELADAFSDSFLILTSNEALAHASADVTAGMSDSERKEMHYWRANRVGDIIFNQWD